MAAAIVVPLLVACAAMAWVVYEYKRYGDRVPLIPIGRSSASHVVILVTTIALPLVAFIAVTSSLTREQMRANPISLWLVALLVTEGCAALAVTKRLHQYAALGWLTFVNDRSFAVTTTDTDDLIQLSADCVVKELVVDSSGRPVALQLHIAQREQTLSLVCAVQAALIRHTRGVARRIRTPKGLALGASNRRFLQLVKPFTRA